MVERLQNYDSRPETMLHIETVRSFLSLVISDLHRRARGHDASKLQSPEVEVFDEFTPKLKNSTYGSEEYRDFLASMKPALDHHYAHNSHHPEHYPWHCPICHWQGNCQQHEQAPQGPNDSGVRYCPHCCRNGMLYESELMYAPQNGIRGMSLLDVIEMLCDWLAATKRHADGDVLKSIEINQKRFGYSDELKQIFLNTLPLLES